MSAPETPPADDARAPESAEGSEAPSAPRRSKTFFYVRVTVLLCLLGGVLLYAWRDVRSRSLRNDWSRTLDVALVVVAGELDPEVMAQLRKRAQALEDRLSEEEQLYRPGAPPPFELHVFEVEAPGTRAPPMPTSDSVVDAARWSWDLRRFTAALDEAAGLGDQRFDTRLYLLAREPVNERSKGVEGIGEEGGRVGLVEVELDATMVDFALFVAAHELLHTVGATDRYDDAGEPLVPDGLADPNLEPLYPQQGTEVMARHRAVAPGRSKPPESLDELVVGKVTAREIGWATP